MSLSYTFLDIDLYVSYSVTIVSRDVPKKICFEHAKNRKDEAPSQLVLGNCNNKNVICRNSSIVPVNISKISSTSHCDVHVVSALYIMNISH